jgi:hypothetical protein
VLDPMPPPLRRRGAAADRAKALASVETGDLAEEVARRGLVLCRRRRRHVTRGSEGWRPRERVLPAAGGHLSALVFVLGVARGAPDLADVIDDQRHDGVIAQAPLARTVVIDEITNSKLARMHAQSLENS